MEKVVCHKVSQKIDKRAMNVQKIEKLRKTIDNVFFFLHCEMRRAVHDGCWRLTFLEKEVL